MTPLLNAGLELMLIGMGTVFVFLTLLVFATGLMSWLIRRFYPAILPPVTADSGADAVPEEHVAAISIALAEHRRRRGEQ
jgi:oxaloacetate decarboxylase (Na+ extruding) subunit gamma